MDKIVEVSGKEVKFRSVATLPKIYKMYFRRDFFNDLDLLQDYKYVMDCVNDKAEINIFENVAWSMAKLADSSLPNLERWKESFEDFTIKDIIKDIQDILSDSIVATEKKTNNKKGTSNGKKTNTEMFLVLCKDCGLQNDDLETMTLGMALDFIDEWISIKNPDKKPQVLEASQEHFNNF